MPSGKVSWFGGPHDSSDSGHTASGGTTAQPGVALYNRSTLGGYYRVTFPNGKSLVLKQTDIGPAPWTGRKVDVTYSALPMAGYHEGNFPTDATVQYQYLGKNPPRGGSSQGGSGALTASPGTVSGQPAKFQISSQFDAKGYQNALEDQTLAGLVSHSFGAHNPLLATGVLSTAPVDPATFTKDTSGVVGGTTFHPGTVTAAPQQQGGGPTFRGVTFTRGVVGIGKALQKLGLHVGENPHFGGVSGGVHENYGYYDHYHGGAIDVTGPASTLNAVADFLAAHKGQLGIPTSGVPNLGGKRGSGVLYQVPGHFDHLHVSASH